MKLDFRSDTLTLPTDEMRQAMASAEVGDDVYGEDPTLIRLQEMAARIMGKEDALFVPSGTMGNLLGILTNTHGARCAEIICEASSHIRLNEVAGCATVAGMQICPIQGVRGAMDPEEVRAAIRDDNIHHPSTALICLENTHNFAGGCVIPLDNMKAIYAIAQEHGIPVHVDGARVFNAAAALGVPASQIAQYCDSITFCLSKGLSAPVGAVLCGTKAFIALARRYRKMLGGGMRQAGVLAAAGIVALTSMVDRLKEDHANARALAEGIAALPGLSIDLSGVQSNIVIFDVSGTGMNADQFVDALGGRDVLVSSVGPMAVRFVCHRHVNSGDVKAALAVMKDMLEA